MTDLLERARKYINAMPDSIMGQGGSDRMYAVATALAHGFALSDADAWALLNEWNRSHCTPPWSESELRHKLKDGYDKPHDHARGHLRGSPRVKMRSGSISVPASLPPVSHKTSIDVAPAKPQRPIKTLNLDREVILPEAMDDPTRVLLRTAFRPGECVGISQERINEDTGRGQPRDAGAAITLEEWLDRLDKRGGDINRIYSSTDKTGAYIRINPMQPGGSKDEHVTAFRHVLLEWDDALTLEKQWNVIDLSKIPCTAVIYSGGKSLHAWARVDAANMQEWKERCAKLFDYFQRVGIPVDEKNKNPSRFSRLPGMVRGDRHQDLLAVKIGAKDWQEWEDSIAELDLPLIVGVASFMREQEAPPAELIQGFLHYGSKAVIGGGSKSNKTFALIDMALAVASGKPWLGMATVKGKVLFCNFEVQKYFARSRFKAICGAREIAVTDDDMDVWNLRGYSASIEIMIPKILKAIHSRNYSLIILDPIYKGLGSRDENSSGDMADLMNEVEYLCVQSGAAVAFGAHFSKGNQSSKFAIDRISGSGVFARDPDSIMTLTPHEEKGCFVVETTLRNFPPKEPFVVRYNYPVFHVEQMADPERFAKPGKKQGQDPMRLLSCIADSTKDKPVSTSQWAKNAGISRTTLDPYTGQLRTDGYIETIGGGTTARKYITEKGLEAVKAWKEKHP